MRLWFLAILLWAISQTLGAQPALSTNDIVAARTCLGDAEVQATPVETPHDVVIAVMAETLSADDLIQFQKEVAAFYQAARNKSTLRLAAISGDAVQFAGPFKTRSQLLASLTDLAHAAPEGAAPLKPLQTYSNLARVLPQLGSDWSTVILAGRFPRVDPELAPYTAAWLATQLRVARLQASYWTPEDRSDILDSALLATGGARLDDGLSPLAQILARPSARWEVSWQGPAPAAAFRVCPATWIGSDGQTVATVPAIAAAAGVVLPDIEHYALLREKIRSLTAVTRQPELSALEAAQAEADLNAALKISPRETETLRLGAALYRLSKSDEKLAPILTSLTELDPAQPALFAELGHTLFRSREFASAEHALSKARDLKPGDAAIAEELARIRLMSNDDRGAIAFLEERLALAPGTQELWLLRADTATRLGDWERNADSTEHAITLAAVPLPRRTALVRLYLQHQNPGRALVHVRAVAGELPADAAVRSEFAGFLDGLKQPAEALAAWKRTLDVDPKLELAHYRVTRLLIEKDAPAEALEAANAGIQADPKSARLYLAKAEIQEKLDRFYDARQTLRSVVADLPDAALLARLANMEDAAGEHAAKYYRALAEVGEKGAAGINRADVLNRGLQAALRDGDLDNAAWFEAQLGKNSVSAAARTRTGNVTVPGGLAALSFIAHCKASTPERFLVEFARTVVRNLEYADKKAADMYTEAIREHFRRVGELAALGTSPAGGPVTVTLSATDKNGQKNAEKVLNLLGWKIRTSKQGVKLDPAEKGERAAHQETATALALDEIGMQKALEAGKPFSFAIPTGAANVILGEEPWRTQFYAKEHLAGGLAEAIAGNLQLAQTYAALGQMDPETAAALVTGLGLKTLAEKYARLLSQHSSALALERGRVAVPGGQPAEVIWAKLAGASPTQPALFFKALLTKDDGKLLAYYAALSALDIHHQRFFTRTAVRTPKFFELFKDAPETQHSNSKHIMSGSFVEFLSEVPLDGDGNVDFPGSPEVWMVARGQSRSTEHAAKMIKKLNRVAAPDVEDDILLRLAHTRYKDLEEQRTELANFMAVVRIDEHRSDPLDEASALLLAQHFVEDREAYPYFAILTGLSQKQFEQFFALTDTLRQLSYMERAAQLAPIDALIELVCLSQQSGAIDEAKAAGLFGKIMEKFRNVSTPATRVAASVDILREMISLGGRNAADPDAAMEDLLLGTAGPSGSSGEGPPQPQTRLGRYRQVLDLQKVPSLSTILALAGAAQNLATGKGTATAEVKVLESKSAGLFTVDLPKKLGLLGKDREWLEIYQPRRVADVVKQFQEKTAKKNVKLQDLEKLSRECLDDIDVPVRWALEGIVYAYYLRPEDLLVSEDPLLLRKHQVVKLDQAKMTPQVFEISDLARTSANAGSYFFGGFAKFGDAVGHAAAMSAKLGGASGEMIAGKQIGAIRATNWEQLRNQDLRLFGLKVAVAKEWVVRAGSQPELQASLAESAFGLLSLTRRAELLAALADGKWRSVWSLLTLSDLYFLADRYLERYPKDPWESAATLALRSESAHNDGSRLQLLGAQFPAMLGCAEPHLRAGMPYEEYESDLLPWKLAERSAEFKMYLALYADRAGLPASALAGVAENAVRIVLNRVQLSDFRDWRSALAAYSEIDGKLWEEASTTR